MTHSWRQQRVVTTDSTNTIADAVASRRPLNLHAFGDGNNPTVRLFPFAILAAVTIRQAQVP